MEANQESRSLIKATAISLVVAIIALVLFILPAEYNIDPTGIGEKLGLTVFNEGTEAVINVSSHDNMQDSVILTVPAGRGIEYKLAMKQFGKATYEWITDGEPVYVDLHGEPKGDTTGYFESFTIATAREMKGSFTAPFEGFSWLVLEEQHGGRYSNPTNFQR